MLAPAHHTAMKHAINARKELGVRTVFNVLGPLTNPAHVKREMIGVFSPELVEPLARVLGKLGSEHVIVVHSEDGMDEISISAMTKVAEYRFGEFKTYMIDPSDFGISLGSLSDLTIQNPDESLVIIKSVFRGEQSPAAEIVALNAGAAIYIAGLADDLHSGIQLALNLLRRGAPADKFDNYVKYTNSF